MKNLLRKSIAIVSMTAMLLGTLFFDSSIAYAASGDTVVYLTKTGDCYHNDGCSYLKKSKIQTTLAEAVKKGKKPCSKCKPGSLDDTTAASTTKASATTTAAAASTKVADSAIETLKTYKGNTKDFNAYTYYINNADLQTAIGADGDKLLKHYNDYGKAEGRKAK